MEKRKKEEFRLHQTLNAHPEFRDNREHGRQMAKYYLVPFVY